MMTETTPRPVSKRPKKAKAAKKAARPVESAQLVPGYRRFIALALSSGQITSINARAVHRYDRFDYAYGLNERLEHVPAEGDRGDITHFYAYAKFKDGGHCFEVLSRAEVDAVRDPMMGYAEMGKETVLRRIADYLPLAVRKAALEEWGETVAGLPQPEDLSPGEERPPVPAFQGEEPQAINLTEEELAGLFPPGYVMRILDAAAERGMPDEVLAEIAGAPVDEIPPEDESAILRAITSWQS